MNKDKPALGIPITFLTLLLALLLLNVALEKPMAEGKLCEKPSMTWSGMCGNTNHCNDQCKNWEDAKEGACHYRFPGYACFCYYYC